MKQLLCSLVLLLNVSSIGFGSEDFTDSSKTWQDPVTEWTWTIASGFSTWKDGLTVCGKNTSLPTEGELRHAMKRLKASPLASQLKKMEASFAWSRTEFDWRSAMAIHLFEGYGRNIWKQDLLVVLCLGK